MYYKKEKIYTTHTSQGFIFIIEHFLLFVFINNLILPSALKMMITNQNKIKNKSYYIKFQKYAKEILIWSLLNESEIKLQKDSESILTAVHLCFQENGECFKYFLLFSHIVVHNSELFVFLKKMFKMFVCRSWIFNQLQKYICGFVHV